MNKRTRQKLAVFILFFAIIGIFPASLFIFVKYKSFENDRNMIVNEMHKSLELFENEIELTFGRILSDLIYLSESCLLQNYLSTGQNIEMLQNNLSLFSKTSGLYDQVRYLDRDGMEIARINYDNGNGTIVSSQHLQNKSHRYYFAMLLGFSTPTILVSPTDLNVENKEIEIPWKPTIRFSIPLFSEEGEYRGALILNYYADHILNDLAKIIESYGFDLYIANPEGYLISGPRKEDLWGFMFEGSGEKTLSSILKIKEEYETSREGLFYSTRGLTLYKKIEMASPQLTETVKSILPDHKMYFMEDHWKIFIIGNHGSSSLLQKSVLHYLLDSYWKLIIFFILLSLTLSLYISIIIERKTSAEKMRDTYVSIMHEVISTLELTSSLKDDDTGNHIKRVASYTGLLCAQYGMNQEEVSQISELSTLHDIGKIGIHDTILKKKGKLTPDEWREMQQHVAIGRKMIGKLRVDPAAANIVRYHHENWDGTGYLENLEGTDIPLEARIVSLADVYDALRTRRAYKEPFSHEVSRNIIIKERGKKFDPEVVECFLNVESEFERISLELSDD